MRPHKQKRPKVKNELCRVLEHVDVDVEICKWLDFQVFSDKDDKRLDLSRNTCRLILWVVKEPKHCSGKGEYSIPVPFVITKAALSPQLF